MKLTWCNYFLQSLQSHSGHNFRIFDLKNSKDVLSLIVSGSLLQILAAIYETVSVPYLTVLGFLEQSSS